VAAANQPTEPPPPPPASICLSFLSRTQPRRSPSRRARWLLSRWLTRRRARSGREGSFGRGDEARGVLLKGPTNQPTGGRQGVYAYSYERVLQIFGVNIDRCHAVGLARLLRRFFDDGQRRTIEPRRQGLKGLTAVALALEVRAGCRGGRRRRRRRRGRRRRALSISVAINHGWPVSF